MVKATVKRAVIWLYEKELIGPFVAMRVIRVCHAQEA